MACVRILWLLVCQVKYIFSCMRAWRPIGAVTAKSGYFVLTWTWSACTRQQYGPHCLWVKKHTHTRTREHTRVPTHWGSCLLRDVLKGNSACCACRSRTTQNRVVYSVHQAIKLLLIWYPADRFLHNNLITKDSDSSCLHCQRSYYVLCVAKYSQPVLSFLMLEGKERVMLGDIILPIRIAAGTNYCNIWLITQKFLPLLLLFSTAYLNTITVLILTIAD